MKLQTGFFHFFDMTFDLWSNGRFHFSHCIQCKIVWAPPPKFVELLQKNLYQKIACFKYFQYLWTIWPWPHSQGHRSHIYVSKCNLKTWHVFSLLGLESLYHSVRDIYHRSTCYTKPRSVWLLWRSQEFETFRIRNTLKNVKTSHSSLMVLSRDIVTITNT